MNYKEVSFVEAINSFRQQTGVKFLYNLEKVKDKRCKDLVLKNVPVNKAIETVLKHFGLTYSMVEGVVVVKETEETSPTTSTHTITGKVVDQAGNPLPGVTVIIKGTKSGVATDVNGNFTITLNEQKEQTLIFSFVGMQTKEVSCMAGKTVTVILEPEEAQLDEVVVTGYQSINRRDMVGSYTTVKAADIMMPAYNSIDQMLQGKIPGMVVVNSSSRIGSSPKITIRGTSTIFGNTDPLWVVDGIIQPDPLPIDASSAVTEDMKNLFDIKNKVIVITGGCGILGKNIANYLAEQGAKIVILDRVEEAGRELEAELNRKSEALFLVTDVLNKEVLEENKKAILERFGTIDVLLNAAGGNMPGATIAPDKTVLDLDVDAFRKVVDLNLFGTVLPTMVFVDVMAKNKKGAIVNFCSESALRPLTRVVGYGSAKAAIGNYTRYMATELATKFSPELRVNAIVPGFLLTNQNRALLTNPDGSYTDRAKTIIAHTPCGRFAEPEELFGTIHYLISDASSFVTGALSVVDGGFDAFSI